MAVMEVQLPSGYVPDQQALQSIRAGNRQVKKVETDRAGERVNIYFDRVRQKVLK